MRCHVRSTPSNGSDDGLAIGFDTDGNGAPTNGADDVFVANASAAVADPDGDGLDDELVLRWDPAANGTMALDVVAPLRNQESQ